MRKSRHALLTESPRRVGNDHEAPGLFYERLPQLLDGVLVSLFTQLIQL